MAPKPGVFPLCLGRERSGRLFPEERRQNHHTEEAKSSPGEVGQPQCPQRCSQRKICGVSPQGLSLGRLYILGKLGPPTKFLAAPGPTKLHPQHPEVRKRRKSRMDSCCLVAREGLHIEIIKSRLNSGKTSLCLVNIAQVSQKLKQRA